MSTVAPAAEPVAPARPSSGITAMLEHTRYVLGENKVNIATFALGRSAPGQDAIALVEIDGALPNHLIEEVQALPGVKQAKALNF